MKLGYRHSGDIDGRAIDLASSRLGDSRSDLRAFYSMTEASTYRIRDRRGKPIAG